MKTDSEFEARINSMVESIEKAALLVSTESASTRDKFVKWFRKELVADLRESGTMTEAEVQRGADVATEQLQKFLKAMSQGGAGRA